MSNVQALRSIGKILTYHSEVMFELGEILAYAEAKDNKVIVFPPYEDSEYDGNWAVQEIRRVISQVRAKFDEVEQTLDKQ